jgi:branched-chain amino acid transport system substrate-binding protein
MLVRSLVCLCSLVLGLAGSTAPAFAQPEPFTINAVLSLSGGASFLGKEIQQALEALETTTNARGGIRGRKVHFAIVDDQTNPQTAVQLTTGILAQPHPGIILGSDVAATCLAMASVVKDGTQLYCLSPAVHPAPGSGMFSSGTSSIDNVKALTRYFRLRGWKRWAVIASTDASGIDFEHAFDLAAAAPESSGVVKVISEHYAPSDVSVAAQVARIKAGNVQAVLVATTGTPFGTVLHAMTDAGLNVPIATSTGNMTYVGMEQYKQFDTSKVYFAGFRFFDQARIGPGPLRNEVTTFYRAFAASATKPDTGQALGWDPALLTIAAYRALGTNATSAQIRAWLDDQQSFVGVIGIYDFKAIPQRGLDDHSIVIATWDPAHDAFNVVSKAGGALP